MCSGSGGCAGGCALALEAVRENVLRLWRQCGRKCSCFGGCAGGFSHALEAVREDMLRLHGGCAGGCAQALDAVGEDVLRLWELSRRMCSRFMANIYFLT